MSTIAIVNAFNCNFLDKTVNVEARGYSGLVIFAPSNAESRDLDCDT